ncbi:MAG: CBS domain-containing protein [Candidatus Lokiarchaeota archaeon]|nr:CBS domain-containing protein [Candidatus Lokiarchaeota archaeon]
MNFKIFTVKGIEVKLNISTLVIVALVGFYSATFYSGLVQSTNLIELIIVGLINGFILLFSIVLHELMHSIMAQKYGLNVSEIELYLFGGVSKIEEDPKTPKSEALISVVGPLASLIFGAILLTFFFFTQALDPILYVTLFYSGLSNIVLGIFNFLPAFPMDGGRVLRSILWKKRGDLLSATKTASKTGKYIGYAMIGLGLLEMFLLGIIGGLWLAVMGYFLSSSAKKAYRQTKYTFQLSKIGAKSISKMPEITIPFGINVQQAIDEYFMKHRLSYFPVEKDDEIVGIITIKDVKEIPVAQRDSQIIGYSMRKLSELPSISENDNGKDAFKQMQKTESRPRLVVVKSEDNSHVEGFIDEQELSSAFQMSELFSE